MNVRSNSSAIFKWVVDDVIAKVKPDFVQEGIEESVLDELRQTWEAKLLSNGLISNGNDDAPPAAAANPPGPGRGPHNAGAAFFAQQAQQQRHAAPAALMGAPQLAQQHMAAAQLLQQHINAANLNRGSGPPSQVNMAAYTQLMAGMSGMKRKEPEAPRQPNTGVKLEDKAKLPQHDGAGDSAATEPTENGGSSSNSEPVSAFAMEMLRRRQLLQQLDRSGPETAAAAAEPELDGDGVNDDGGFECSDVFSAELLRLRRTVPQHDGPGDGAGSSKEGDAAGPSAGHGEATKSDDEVLSEDSEAEEEEEEITNFLCCQFEKVTRVKNKWKISMRDGVFHINGKDYLFKKATGEWSWV